MGNLFSKSTAVQVGSKRSFDDVDGESSNKKKARVVSMVKEADVGILAFVNPHLKGFHSILKYRYIFVFFIFINSLYYRAEDFLVNEVDMDKNIIRLTSLEAPKLKGREKLEIYSPQVFDEKVSSMLGAVFASQLRRFLNNPQDTYAMVSVTVDKQLRLGFYRLVEDHLQEEIVCRGKDGKVNVTWKVATPEHGKNKRNSVFFFLISPNLEFIDFHALGGEYLQVHMTKQNIDTMNAINVLSKKTNIQSKVIGYAGTKDARAITTQALTLKGVRPGILVAAKEELQKSKIYIGNYSFVPKGLTLGDLGGNHFTIVLRDVQGANALELQVALESLSKEGFLNYFGMQRFGTSSVFTHTIGRAIMKKNYQEASDLILDPREGGKL
jgi:tRNA pseudouridine13 synthase